MNKKTTYGLLTLAVLGVGAYFLLRKRKKVSKFRQLVVDNAEKELDIWDGYVETDAEVKEDLLRYWESAGYYYTDVEYNSDDPYTPPENPWSAVFVSSVMKDSGAGDDFDYSVNHASYLIYAKDNRLNYPDEPFKAYRTEEVEPEVGDIVCKNRDGGNATYEDIQVGDPLHCDIITDVGFFSVDAIGGNLSNTVKRVNYGLDFYGMLTDEHFAIIKTDL
jgi:hypothetical protein